MNDIEKRFEELAERADERCYTTFSEFLNMDEQSELKNLRLKTPPVLNGGYPLAERCIAGFGEYAESTEFPIKIIKAEPLSKKFADKLSHRDFLGSLMGLGIKREVVGDIIIEDNVGYIFCLDIIEDYIKENLSKVRHTSVKCQSVLEIPKTAIKEPEVTEHFAASARLDVIIASVYKLSRNEVKELFNSRLVFVNSVLNENFSFVPKDGDVVSVRGYGRFVYCGVFGNTKKGRNIFGAKIYK